MKRILKLNKGVRRLLIFVGFSFSLLEMEIGATKRSDAGGVEGFIASGNGIGGFILALSLFWITVRIYLWISDGFAEASKERNAKKSALQPMPTATAEKGEKVGETVKLN